MKNLEIDIETFSSVNLAKAGVYRYAESPDFEILLFGYRIDGRDVKVVDLARGEKIPTEILTALEDESVTKWAFNAKFERICISRMLGYEPGTYLASDSWKCSMVWSAYAFQLAGVVVNTEHTREAITKDQMRKFLKFVHDDNVYCKYYEVFYILFHTGLRISEFCGLTIKDLDMKNRIINIDHQLQRLNNMEYHIESTKTNAGTRKIPMTEDVYRMFQAILEDRPTDLPEVMINGYVGFLFRDKNGMPEVALHWEHRFKHAVNRYNSIFKVQMPKITPHICRHTYCSNQAKAGMNPKTLQYLMGHSDIGVTMNTYTHLGLDDAKNEMIRMEELEQARKEVDKAEGKKPMKQNMFKVV